MHRVPLTRHLLQGITVATLLVVALGLLAAQSTMASAAPGQGAGLQDVFIGFDRTPGPSERALVERAGGTVRFSYTLVPAVAATLPQGAIAGLERNPRVTYIEPDGVVHLVDHDGTWNTEIANAWGVAHIGSGHVHADGNTGGGAKIGIIDTGIAYGHPDLAANFAGGHDFVNNDDDPLDDHGHGTHVAGTACAVLNGWGVAGVAGSCSLYSLKVLNASGSGQWSWIVAAMEWSAGLNGGTQMDVVNLSLGGSQNPGTTVRDAMDNAYAAGVVIVAAAGNSGNCGGNNDSVEYPARYDSVIAVAATNENNARPCFSSTGPAVELSAPGVSVLSTWPGSASNTNPQPTELCDGGGSPCAYYKLASGTSMASPHVAGVAALVFATNPELTNVAVRQALRESAIDLGSSNRYGYGLVYAPAAVGVEPTPPATGTIAGTVTDAGTAEPIAGATVAVTGTQLGATTAPDGTYTIADVPEGAHSVSASAEGYEAATQSATVVADQTATVDFALTPVEESGEPGDPGEPGNPPTVTAIAPDRIAAGTSTSATITGTGFVEGATVTFENGQGSAPSASNVVVLDGTTITLTITVSSGGPPRDRPWDVRVTNPDGTSGVLEGGLIVFR